jgi:hypothetical protein
MADDSSSGLGDAWSALKSGFAAFKSRPSPRPPFIGPVAQRSGDSLVSGRAFAADASYFGVRLVEMRLAEGAKYFSEFLPMGVCIAEYTFGTERRRIPLVLSNETVQTMLGGVGAKVGRVELADIPVVRRAPVKEDNLALFVGLFRMPFSDIARSVLQLAADVSEELGGPALGASTKVAAKLYDRVSGLFKLNDVQARFAYLDGMALKQSGYVLVSGPLPADLDPTDFVVENSRLSLRPGAKSASLDKLDYCLIAIEQRDSLFTSGAELRGLAGLPFHARWRNVTSLLAQRKSAEAEEALLALRAEVVASPDLTEEDRLIAVGGYDVAYAKYAQPLLAKAGGLDIRTRGLRSGTPVTALRAEANARAKSDAATAAALNAIVLDLQRAPSNPNTAADARADTILAETFSTLREPLSKARSQGARASILANALSVGLAANRDN